MCRSGPGLPDGAVSRLCPTPRRGGASRTRKPRATVVGLGWPADAKGEPRSSRPRPSAPQPPATQPSIVGPPRRWVSAGSSPHLPLFIILREIQRELCLRGEEGRQKERKSGSREMRRGRGGRGDMWHARGGPRHRAWHIPSELGYCTTSGGRGGGAPVGGAPGAEPSARAGLWKRGDSLRGADDQPRFTVSSARPISLTCQRTRASGRLRTRLPCGAGGAVKRLTASSPTSHTPHPTTSRRSRASSALIGGKAARRRRQRRRSGRRQSSRGAREKAKKVLIFRPRPPLTPPDPPPPTHPPVPGGGKVLQGTVRECQHGSSSVELPLVKACSEEFSPCQKSERQADRPAGAAVGQVKPCIKVS